MKGDRKTTNSLSTLEPFSERKCIFKMAEWSALVAPFSQQIGVRIAAGSGVFVTLNI